MGWAKSGFADAPEEAPRTSFIPRLRLPQPEGNVKPSVKKARPVIITTKGDALGVWEHEVWIGDRKYYFTSLAEHEISSYDPLAELARLYRDKKLKFSGKYPPVRPPYYAVMYTGLDLGVWTDRNGKEHDCSKVLIPVKQSQIGQFELEAEKRKGNLFGCEYRVMRIGGEKSPQIGDWWDFQKRHKRQELEEQFEDYLKDNPELLDAYDVEKLLAPKTVAELEKVAMSIAGRKIIEQIRPDWYVPEDEDEADERPTKRKKPSSRDEDEEDEEEEEDERQRKKRRRDEEDEDEPEEAEDSEEEEERPRKKKLKKGKKSKGGRNIPF